MDCAAGQGGGAAGDCGEVLTHRLDRQDRERIDKACRFCPLQMQGGTLSIVSLSSREGIASALRTMSMTFDSPATT